MSQNETVKVKEEKVKGYNKETGEWHCIICGQNMGKENSRQLCEKWMCPYEDEEIISNQTSEVR